MQKQENAKINDDEENQQVIFFKWLMINFCNDCD